VLLMTVQNQVDLPQLAVNFPHPALRVEISYNPFACIFD